MSHSYFISYSFIDGREFSRRLRDDLVGDSVRSIEVWHAETTGVRAGPAGWDHQIDEALRACAGVLFVMTSDSVKVTSTVSRELLRARTYRKTIIPLVVESGVTVPFLYEGLKTINFVDNFERGAAQLRGELAWLETTEGRIYSLQFQRASVERELGRSDLDKVGRDKVTHELATIDEQFELLRHASAEPRQAQEEHQRKIEEAIEREAQRPQAERRGRVPVVNRPPASPPGDFFDRISETRLIGQFLQDPSKRLMTITGRGGVGKTAMVCRILSAIERGEFQDAPNITVTGIVYLGSGSEKAITFENFHAGLSRLLPEHARPSADEADAAGVDIRSQTDVLVSRYTQAPAIVLLDNFEDLLDSKSQIANPDVEHLLEALLELPQHAVKVIITTRETPQGLRLHRPERQMPLPLDEGLKSPYAEDLLRSLDYDGRLHLRSASDAVLGEIRARTLGIPRALEVFCAILNDPYSSLQEVLSDTQAYLPTEVVDRLSADAFHRLDRTAQRVVEALAVFGRPVIPEAVDFALQPFEPAIACEPTLRRLVGMYLVRRAEGGRCFLHPVDQTYARSQIPALPAGGEDAAESAYTTTNLTRRAAEYFRMIRTDPSTWRSISDFGPQFAEFELLIEAAADEALDVLQDIIGYLDRWGYRRQIARMAEQLRIRTSGETRALVLAAAAEAYSSLEQNDLARERYQEALEVGRNIDAPTRRGWMLQLAYAYLNLNNDPTAGRLFNTCLEQSSEEDEAELRVNALIGLGTIAARRWDYATAELLYLRALDSYVPWLGTDIHEKDGGYELSVVKTPSDLAIADPALWYFLDRLYEQAEQDPASTETASAVVLFGVAKAASGSPAATTNPSADDATKVEVFPLQVNTTLAGIWLRLADLYARWDRLPEAHAACRLAANMHVQLENDEGTLEAIEQLRTIVSNFSRSRVDELLKDLQVLLDRAKKMGNRQLTAEIQKAIADSNLDQERPDQAEAAFVDMRRIAMELDDAVLETRADFGLARVLRVRGDWKGAAERLESIALRISANQHTLRGEIESELAEIDIARYDVASAVRRLEMAVAAFEIGGEDLLRVGAEQRLAFLEIENRQYEVAIRRLERAANVVKTTGKPSAIASTLADLAAAYSAGGNRTAAIATAEEALKITDDVDVPPARAGVLLTLCNILKTQGRYEGAQDTANQACEIYRRIDDVRGEVRALLALAAVFSDMRDGEAQLQAARQAARLAEALPDPEDKRPAQMTVALALSDAKAHSEAVALIEEAVRERPDDPIAIGNLGWVLYAAGEYERSIVEGLRALERDPAQAFVVRNIGHANLALRRPDEAEKAYRRAISERRGGEDFHETIQCVKDLMEKYPDLPRAADMLGLLEQAQKDFEKHWKTSAEESVRSADG